MPSGDVMSPVGGSMRGAEPIRVLVCAAHAHVQWGLKKVVEGEWPRMQLVAMLSSLADVESFLQAHATEVAVLDFPKPSEEVFSTVERLCRSFSTSFVMLDGDEQVRNRLTSAGVNAVLPLDAPAAEILNAMYLSAGTSSDH